MKKLSLLAMVLLCAIGGAAQAETVEEKYQRSCHVCHATGVANAPKLHDVAAWKPHLDKGMDALLKSVKNGFNAMPPGGLCTDCSDDDYKALIEYMASPAE